MSTNVRKFCFLVIFVIFVLDNLFGIYHSINGGVIYNFVYKHVNDREVFY